MGGGVREPWDIPPSLCLPLSFTNFTTRSRDTQAWSPVPNPGHSSRSGRLRRVQKTTPPLPPLFYFPLPALPSCLGRAHPLLQIHQSASGAASMAQGPLVGSQLAPGPEAVPRLPLPESKPLHSWQGWRSAAGTEPRGPERSARTARPPPARPPPLCLRPGRGRGGRGGGTHGAGPRRRGRRGRAQ